MIFFQVPDVGVKGTYRDSVLKMSCAESCFRAAEGWYVWAARILSVGGEGIGTVLVWYGSGRRGWGSRSRKIAGTRGDTKVGGGRLWQLGHGRLCWSSHCGGLHDGEGEYRSNK